MIAIPALPISSSSYMSPYDVDVTNKPYNTSIIGKKTWQVQQKPLRITLSKSAKKALREHNVARFAEFAALKDGWHFGQGETMQPDSLVVLESFLSAYSTFPERLSLFLSEEGNLELAWRSENNETTALEFYADRIGYYIETLEDEGEVEIKDIPILVQKLLRA